MATRRQHTFLHWAEYRLINGTFQRWEQDMFFPWFGNNVNTFSHAVGEVFWHTCAFQERCYPPRSPSQLLRTLFLSKNMDWLRGNMIWFCICAGSQIRRKLQYVLAPERSFLFHGLGVRDKQGHLRDVYTDPFFYFRPYWTGKNYLHATKDVLPLVLPTETSSSFKCWQTHCFSLLWCLPEERAEIAPL